MPAKPPKLSNLIANPYTSSRKMKSVPVENARLPEGSGFDKLIRRRADTNNLAGPQNYFGDRVNRALNTQVNNPRQGQEYSTSVDARGRTIHTYKYGKNTNRVVLPLKMKKKNVGTYKYFGSA